MNGFGSGGGRTVDRRPGGGRIEQVDRSSVGWEANSVGATTVIGPVRSTTQIVVARPVRPQPAIPSSRGSFAWVSSSIVSGDLPVWPVLVYTRRLARAGITQW